jgi:hypothetical protein
MSKFLSFSEAKDFIQSLQLISQSDWKGYCKSGRRPEYIPVSPDKTYKKTGWISWADWLGTRNKAPGDYEFLSFQEARKHIHSLNLNGRRDWKIFCKTKPANIPAAPDRTYKNKGWINWGDWLGTGTISTHQVNYLPFEEAREFARSFNFNKRADWEKFCKSANKPSNIPMAANNVYKNSGWISWADWLGVAKEYKIFEEARNYVHSLKLNARGEWYDYCKNGKLPNDIPVSPSSTYGQNGWINWADWLGTENVANFNKKFRSFEDARAYVRALNIKNYDEWREYRKSGNKPKDIPGAPNTVYKDEGWLGYSDWLGIVNRWNKPAILAFVKSLLPVLGKLEPVELYSIMRRNGLIDAAKNSGRNTNSQLIEDILSLSRLSNQQDISDVITNRILTSNNENGLAQENSPNSSAELFSDLNNAEQQNQLPVLEVNDILSTVDRINDLIFDPDESVLEFLLNKAVAKIWKCFLETNEIQKSLDNLLDYQGGMYSQVAKERFLDQYNGAKNLVIPAGYSFKKAGILQEPNLMQRLVAYRINTERSLGNWSGVGAGKTLSAILASRVIDAKLTVVIALNNTINGWKNEILSAYPNSYIHTKKLLHNMDDASFPNYLILNYEAFQLRDSENYVEWLINNYKIDFVILDEIQHAKRRDENTTKRRRLLEKLLFLSKEKNPIICTLGISATPVINNLDEAASLLKMIKGTAFEDLDTYPSLFNCVAMHEKLITNGVRYIPPYKMIVKEIFFSVPGDCLITKLREIGKFEILKLEQILLEVKLPSIKKYLKPGTIIYTHYVAGLVNDIKKYLHAQEYSYAEFTGNEKNGLDKFLNQEVDILIASSTVGTGLDGLQRVCNQLIILNLPWTHSGYQQLLGRIYRQGSVFEKINIIVPQVVLEYNGSEWSWDKQRMNRILYKKTLGDAVLDGVIPDNEISTVGTMLEDARKALHGWITSLENTQELATV